MRERERERERERILQLVVFTMDITVVIHYMILTRAMIAVQRRSLVLY